MKIVTMVDKRPRLREHPYRAFCHDNVQINTASNGVHATHAFIRLMKFANVAWNALSLLGIYSGVMLCKFRSRAFLSIIKRSLARYCCRESADFRERAEAVA